METKDTILTRSSVREFTGEAVSKEHLDLLLKAGMAAPTACNVQPWEFIVISSRETLTKLGIGAPLGIIICGKIPAAVTQKWFLAQTWIQDCSAAAENILLMAHDLGLGACWHLAYPVPEIINAFKSACSLPFDVQPLCIISAGHPANEVRPIGKWNESKIHFERW